MRIGVDLGGSKIEVVALADDGQTLRRERVATPQGDYMATLMAVVALVEGCEQALGQRGSVGIGIPGTEANETGLVKNANSTCLIGKPLRRDLQALLHREVRLANDANCFALSEAGDGAGAGAASVFGVILGTGVGGGIVINGGIVVGANGIGGEWGHNPLAAAESFATNAPRCYCGRQGCIETWLSGPGLSADHECHGGAPLRPAEIAQGAEAGDPACEATLQRYERRLACALAGVINIVDPEVIVLGGGLSNIERLYRTVPTLWGRHIFSDTVRTRLLRHRHGDSSGVRGAAWLWPA